MAAIALVNVELAEIVGQLREQVHLLTWIKLLHCCWCIWCFASYFYFYFYFFIRMRANEVCQIVDASHFTIVVVADGGDKVDV